MPEENGSQEIQREPDAQASIQNPPQPPGSQNPPAPPAGDDSNSDKATADELDKIRQGEQLLIGIGMAGVLVNLLLGAIYYQQLTQMRIATEASRQAVEVARETMEYNGDQFDRAMQHTIDQQVTQYIATQSSVKAAKAAQSAADTAATQLELADRPWVFIKDIQITDPLRFRGRDNLGTYPVGMGLEIVLRNSGNSPAVDVSAVSTLYPEGSGAEPIRPIDILCSNTTPESARQGTVTLFPGTETLPSKIPVELNEEELTRKQMVFRDRDSGAVTSRFIGFKLVVCVTYRPVFNPKIRYYSGIQSPDWGPIQFDKDRTVPVDATPIHRNTLGGEVDVAR